MTNDVSDWWRTAIIDVEPGRIDIRGTPIQDLIGRLGFGQMIWLMVMGDTLSAPRAALFEAALVAAVDHGPQAPSIATARMAATCGVGLQSAMASGLNMLGDVHGGAGEQCVALYHAIADHDGPLSEGLTDWQAQHGPYLPGFGHRFHKVEDPRAPRLLGLVAEAAQDGVVSGRFAEIAQTIEAALQEKVGRPVPLNIDGATAVIYAELGCPPPLARGFFGLSRSVGLLAHAWEESQSGKRIKGPTPPGYGWTYAPDSESGNS